MTPNKKEMYRAFASHSLLDIWPRLYRVPVIWVSVVFNIVMTLASLYLTNALNQKSVSVELGLYLLCITSIIALAHIVNEGLIEWISAIEENTVRGRLGNAASIASSVVNNDLGISISIIGFYVYFPAVLLSCLLYAAYILYVAPMSFIMLVVLVLLAYVPGKIYAAWRKKIILSLRNARNILVDEYDSKNIRHYNETIDNYAVLSMEFFWKDTYALVALKVAVFLILLFTLLISRDTEYALSVTIVMGMLLNAVHQLYNAVCDFQEDYYSLSRVKEAMSNHSEK